MARRRRNDQPMTLSMLIEKLRPKAPEFRQDDLGTGFLHKLYLTYQQRMVLLRWGSYALCCLVAVILQDCLLSQMRIFGAYLDLPACVLLLITVIEGTEAGSMFILLASIVYYFTGSAPGPYVVAALTILGMAATLFRQIYWHRGRSTLLLCAGISLMLYELTVFGAAIFSKLTHWGRLPRFVMTGVLSTVVMVALFPLIHKLGQIGGHTWKE